MLHPFDRRLGAALFAAAIAASACSAATTPSMPPTSSSGPTPATGPTATPGAWPTGETGAIAHPTGATELVLRFDEGGGFVAPAFELARTPFFSLFGDGTVVYRPASAAPPAQSPREPMRFAPLLVARMTEAQVQGLLRDALGAGGLAIARPTYENHQVADAPTATFTIDADGRQKRVSVYALGIGMDQSAGPDASILAAMAALGERLRNFDRDVAAGNATAAGTYTPTRYRGSLLEGGFAPGPARPWPWPAFGPDAFASAAPDGGAPSKVLGASDVAALKIDTLEGGASDIALLGPDGKTYTMALRPLLPDEQA